MMNIIYEMDTKAPLASVIKATFYEGKEGRAFADLMETVLGGKAGNASYGRYWHGSMIFVRPMHMITDISGIYRIFSVLFLFGFIGILTRMAHRRMYRTILCLFTAWVLTGGYLMTSCIQYMNTSFVTLCMIPLFIRAKEKGREHLLCLCVVDGVAVCFMDFLTVETLAITIPMLCLLGAFQEMPAAKTDDGWPDRVFEGLGLWILSYAGMFAVKWVLMGILSGPAALEEIKEKAFFRIKGEPIRALKENIQMLLPLRWEVADKVGSIFAVIWALVLAVMIFVLAKRFSKKHAAAYIILAMIPYLRYMLLSEHSAQHSFFTYRAQMATIFVLTMTVCEGFRSIIAKDKWGIRNEKY